MWCPCSCRLICTLKTCKMWNDFRIASFPPMECYMYFCAFFSHLLSIPYSFITSTATLSSFFPLTSLLLPSLFPLSFLFLPSFFSLSSLFLPFYFFLFQLMIFRDFQARQARQGGVGGAEMKITVRNLRIREDTPKYLRNLALDRCVRFKTITASYIVAYAHLYLQSKSISNHTVLLYPFLFLAFYFFSSSIEILFQSLFFFTPFLPYFALPSPFFSHLLITPCHSHSLVWFPLAIFTLFSLQCPLRS